MKKFLLSLFTIFCVLATANAETYTHTFTKGELTTTGGTLTLSDIEWNATEAEVIEWNATKGIQIGSKNNLTFYCFYHVVFYIPCAYLTYS